MGYVNRDRRYVHISRADKTTVKRLRRRAEKRADQGEHQRKAARATRWGWYHA